MTEKKNGFMMYKSHWEAISDLEDKYLGQLMRAIFEYQIDGREPEKHDVIYRDFKHLKAQFMIDDAKYQRVADRNAENGKVGGRPRKPSESNGLSENPKNPVGFQEPRKADNGNDNVKDNDNDLNNPLPPSSPKGSKGKKKTREETTREEAIAHYKTEVEAAMLIAPAAAEGYAKLAREICGERSTECPNGMVKTLMRLPEQLTFDQYQNLCRKMGGHDSLRGMLIEMHTSFDQSVKAKNTIHGVADNWWRRRATSQNINNPPVKVAPKHVKVEQP